MTSELELKALHILQDATKAGHTALPEGRLVNALSKVTDQDEESLLASLERSEIITTKKLWI